MPVNVDKWTVFSLLEQEFLERVKLACVFGSSGNEALILTDDDQVFAIGSNCSGCLGVGDTVSGLEPRRVDILCGKKVKKIAYGSGPHVLAVTGDGDLYVFGHNGYCQLGNGSTSTLQTPTLLATGFGGKKIIEVAAGSHHSLALTSEGEIYAWGQNNCGQVGNGSTNNQSNPRKVTAGLGQKLVISVTCGQTSSVALTDNGEIFSFGYNGNGQLGLGNNVNQANPCKVGGILTGIHIQQIVCGYAHTLALSDTGNLYAFGANSYGQLGTGNKANAVSPQQVGMEKGRWTAIAATHYNHVSVGSLQTGKIMMWGQCRGQAVVKPVETRFSTLHDVFACFAAPAVTFKPLEVDEHHESSMQKIFAAAFDDPLTSDLKFFVEKKPIHVHKAILRIRCEHFRSMFSSTWKENESEIVTIDHYSYVVYYSFLNFLYTDKLSIPPEDALGLLDLADAYCEKALKHECEQLLKSSINVEFAPILYSAAVKYNAISLQEFCFKFILNHSTEVFQSQDLTMLEGGVLKDLIRKLADHNAFRN